MPKLINLLFRAGLSSWFHPMGPHRLTVLAYHRIGDPYKPGFDTFKPNLSATPTTFAAQMDFMRQHFNIVSADEVVAWRQDQATLPPYPALITFDDGYRDNFDYAFPILQQWHLPATIFLATDYIGNTIPFYYDLIAYCFYHTRQREVDLPLIGRQQWDDENSRVALMTNWLALLKKLPDDEKWTVVNQLPQALGLSVPASAFAELYLTWDQVRTMVKAGIEMGAHTQSHPILTRIGLEQVQTELAGSKERIETETNQPVTTFAYPNGLPTDFNADIQAVLQQVGFMAAFTLMPGPARLAEVQQAPLAIRRIYLSHKDTFPRFVAKVMGLPRLLRYRAGEV